MLSVHLHRGIGQRRVHTAAKLVHHPLRVIKILHKALHGSFVTVESGQPLLETAEEDERVRVGFREEFLAALQEGAAQTQA